MSYLKYTLFLIHKTICLQCLFCPVINVEVKSEEKIKLSLFNRYTLAEAYILEKTPQLNSVSSQCTRGKSSLACKPDVHPKFFNGKKLFKNVTLQI